ncbi:MAG: hypothetical protein LBI81_03855 [Puniceicoccales bacterium]|jgi:uncharacterized protein YpmS|nr:hypothetical protein [Puniceicoccales bacterium]
MEITTSDGKTIGNFNGFLGVIDKIQQAIDPHQNIQPNEQSSSVKSSNGNGHPIISSSSSSSSTPTKALFKRKASVSKKSPKKCSSEKRLQKKIGSVLQTMAEQHWDGKIYSEEEDAVFTEGFIQELNKLLRLLKTASPQQNGENQNNPDRKMSITSLQLQDALKWLDSAMNASDWVSTADQQPVHLLIRQLEDQRCFRR